MNNTEILRKAIEFIANGPLGNYVIIEKDEYYIQFTPCHEAGKIYIEAISEQFCPALEGVKPQFKKLGYTLPRQDVECYNYNKDVEVTIMDLPQQLEMMRAQTAGKDGADRIHGYGCNLLDESVKFPTPAFDVIWMSQFLDCFSEEEVTSICRRAAESMNEDSRLYIMETFWDRQKYETAAYCLTLTSIYFTALANGNSKMYHSDDMERCVNNAGLEVEKIVDGLGLGHSIMICKKKNG